MSFGNTIYMDLGDFIPESYTLRFAVGSRAYVFDFAEATVFEVLQFMTREAKEDVVSEARAIILPFLRGHLTEGDAKQLQRDLLCLPYKGKRGTLDLERILEVINKRFRRKSPWGEQKNPEQPCIWFLRQIAFLMQASEGALSHETIMGLSWRQFGVYMDSFTWLLREQTDKGRAQNARDDLTSMSRNPQVKAKKEEMIRETKERVAHLKNRSLKRGSLSRNLLR
jgi:hypothetical protein